MSESALDRDEQRYGRAGAASGYIYGTISENRGVSKALDHVDGEALCDAIKARVQLAIDRAVAAERARCLGFVRAVRGFFNPESEESERTMLLIVDDLEKAFEGDGGDDEA